MCHLRAFTSPETRRCWSIACRRPRAPTSSPLIVAFLARRLTSSKTREEARQPFLVTPCWRSLCPYWSQVLGLWRDSCIGGIKQGSKHKKTCLENQCVFILLAFDTFSFQALEVVDFLKMVQHIHSSFAIQKGVLGQLVCLFT